MNLKSMFGFRRRTEEKKASDVLRIECDDCDGESDYGCDMCLRCMRARVIGSGEPERIVLHRGMDKEYSGDAVRILNDLSRIDLVAKDAFCNGGGRCLTCPSSMDNLMKDIWADFPEMDVDPARKILDSSSLDDDRCAACNIRTHKAIDKIEAMLKEVSDDIVKSAYRVVGV